MRMQTYIIDYAYGFNARTCEPDIVSKLRTEAALRALRDFPDARIVLGAGMKKMTGDCGALADSMERQLLDYGVSAEKIIRNPRGSNTLDETEAAYDALRTRGDDIYIVCATSRFHGLRVKYIWLFRYGIWPALYASELPARKRDWIRELYKIPRDIIRALVHRI